MISRSSIEARLIELGWGLCIAMITLIIILIAACIKVNRVNYIVISGNSCFMILTAIESVAASTHCMRY